MVFFSIRSFVERLSICNCIALSAIVANSSRTFRAFPLCCSLKRTQHSSNSLSTLGGIVMINARQSPTQSRDTTSGSKKPERSLYKGSVGFFPLRTVQCISVSISVSILSLSLSLSFVASFRLLTCSRSCSHFWSCGPMQSDVGMVCHFFFQVDGSPYNR